MNDYRKAHPDPVIIIKSFNARKQLCEQRVMGTYNTGYG